MTVEGGTDGGGQQPVPTLPAAWPEQAPADG